MFKNYDSFTCLYNIIALEFNVQHLHQRFYDFSRVPITHFYNFDIDYLKYFQTQECKFALTVLRPQVYIRRKPPQKQ